MSLSKTIALSIITIAILAPEALAQSSPLTGDQIIEKMAAQYASVKSYQDVGVVQEVFGSGRIHKVNEFKTYFVRPDLIRFEWRDAPEESRDSRPNIFWSDGAEIFSLYNFSDGPEKAENISRAVAGATGISRGAAHTIPRLLLTDVIGFSLTEMHRVTFLSHETFEGEECFVVRGFHPFGFSIDVWISKRDMLIRKIREEGKNGTFEEDIRREVKINNKIPESTFKFKPPPSKKAERIEKSIG